MVYGFAKACIYLSVVFDCIYKFVVCVCKHLVVRSVYLGLLKLYNYNRIGLRNHSITKVNRPIFEILR